MNIEDHKITFINRNDEYHTTQITISSDAVLSDVIEAFELFLRGSGYDLEGSIGIVDDSESVAMPQKVTKACTNCKFDYLSPFDVPCSNCENDHSNWQPKQ